jgi:hypothetical protein
VGTAFTTAIITLVGSINPEYYQRYRPLNSQSISQIMHKVSVGDDNLPGVTRLDSVNSTRVINKKKKENESSKQKCLRVEGPAK